MIIRTNIKEFLMEEVKNGFPRFLGLPLVGPNSNLDTKIKQVKPIAATTLYQDIDTESSYRKGGPKREHSSSPLPEEGSKKRRTSSPSKSLVPYGPTRPAEMGGFQKDYINAQKAG
jgi:hypothetical protein